MIDSKLPNYYLLQHRYSIRRNLGQGGFGITYLAFDQQLEKDVCIKELFIAGNCIRTSNMYVLSESNRNFIFSDFIKRFVKEARQLALFNHPNIVRVIDVFEGNNTAYIVMEYVEGETLKDKVTREGCLSQEEAIDIITKLLDAVEEVHNKGLLHRDLKPENILVTPQMNVVLIDFGSVRTYEDGSTITQTAMLTPGYAPLEQYSARGQIGKHTDIYALGATLYHLLTGKNHYPPLIDT